MPKWVTPNILTGIGFLAAVIIGVSYWLTNFDKNFLWLASFGFILNWFGDSLDGTVARHRKIERPQFGYFIDHSVDALTQVIIAIGIGLSPFIGIKYALFVLMGYLLVSIHTYITIYVIGVFKISFNKFGPTEIRVLAILANTLIFFIGIPQFNLLGMQITLYELVFAIAGSVLILIFLTSTIKQAIEITEIEKKLRDVNYE